MPDRTRPIRREICLNEQELSVVRHKMNQLGTRNFGAYARKMLIDGYIIKVDYTEQKKLAAAVSRAASNINHVCRRINSTGRCYEDDVAELKERIAAVHSLAALHAGGRILHQRQAAIWTAAQPHHAFSEKRLGVRGRECICDLHDQADGR